MDETIQISGIVDAKLGLVLHVGRRSGTLCTDRLGVIIGREAIQQAACAIAIAEDIVSESWPV